MKSGSMMKILSRYVLSAAGVALVLLALNLAVTALWLTQSKQYDSAAYRVSEASAGLRKEAGGYVLSGDAMEEIDARYAWAMLLDGGGGVVWSRNLPGGIPLRYTVSEVAGFTRWYLKDYPVYVWRREDGLFVLGGAKGSAWKMRIELPQQVMENVLVWIPCALALNGAAAVLLALLFGLRLFRALRPITDGIRRMAERRPAALPADGLLGELAEQLNRTSARLTRQAAALRKRDDARAAWIAGVSHDIRTPLSIVMGYASQWEENPGLPRPEREQAGVVRLQGERIRKLVDDLNLASRLEYAMQPLRRESLSLAALTRGVAAEFLNGGLAAGYSIEAAVREDARDAVLTGDGELLRRALSNLISNSIRHNPEGCAVRVVLDREPTHFTVSVSDNGTGFPREVLEGLKKPESPDGLQKHGLGLTIVRQIVRAHGGAAEFRNLPEGGCAAVLRLPAPE